VPGDGLPAGVVGLGARYAARALAELAPGAAAPLPAAEGLAAEAILMPTVIAAATGVDVPPPTAPLTMGTGAVAAELAGPDDRELFARVREALAPAERDDPERVAAAAQEVRLPVLPYRRAPEPGAPPPDPLRALPEPAGLVSLDGLTVVDLSSMWAGPLTTALLARFGARVVKIEMPGRPDGLRAWGRPSGAAPSPFFRALNRGKEIVALDLRQSADRARFEALLEKADLLVESYSRRVMPNLGYDAETLDRLRPGLIIARLRAFPRGPLVDWTAYGSGIHAVSGLGDVGGGRFAPAALSYPDPLAGLLLFATCLARLAAGRRGPGPEVAEVSLLGSVAPLLDRGGAR
jgi:hypothetical protein